MPRTQILVLIWAAYNMDYGFRRCFADGLSQSLVSSVAQAK